MSTVKTVKRIDSKMYKKNKKKRSQGDLSPPPTTTKKSTRQKRVEITNKWISGLEEVGGKMAR